MKRSFVLAAAAMMLIQIGPIWAQEIVLGQSVALTGPAQELGKEMQQGAQTYFDAVNAAGGIRGKRIVLRTLDDSRPQSDCPLTGEVETADGKHRNHPAAGDADPVVVQQSVVVVVIDTIGNKRVVVGVQQVALVCSPILDAQVLGDEVANVGNSAALADGLPIDHDHRTVS